MGCYSDSFFSRRCEHGCRQSVKRVTGIEPVTRAWKARMLPLHHTRMSDNFNLCRLDCQVGRERLELSRAYAQQILSLVRLPIPPPSLDVRTIIRLNRTIVNAGREDRTRLRQIMSLLHSPDC